MYLRAAFKVAGECLAGVQMSQHLDVDAVVWWLHDGTDCFIHKPCHVSVPATTSVIAALAH